MSRYIRGLAAGPEQFSLLVRFGDQIGPVAEPLLTTGHLGDANFVWVKSDSAGMLTFGLDAWGAGDQGNSGQIPFDPAKTYVVDIQLGAGEIRVYLDGALVWAKAASTRAMDNPTVGENRLGGSSTGPRFSGNVNMRIVPAAPLPGAGAASAFPNLSIPGLPANWIWFVGAAGLVWLLKK